MNDLLEQAPARTCQDGEFCVEEADPGSFCPWNFLGADKDEDFREFEEEEDLREAQSEE